MEVAERIGYPIMLKATSGGGGRGIRRCDSPADLKRNYERVISEATKAFGRADVFLEKCVVNPKHIEVQVLADHHGNCIHLYERDCSIQRRNQKLIEIAPSPQLDEAQRQYVGGLAVLAARAVGYTNAGTVEFLQDADGRFYFMEMNTRIQVEHTITETITGVDLVEEQIRVAAGLPLRYRQDQITRRGFALQFRINAEDPQNSFLPSFGRISRYYAPGGPGVRTDGAIYTGYTVPPYYDSMLRQGHRLGAQLGGSDQPRRPRAARHGGVRDQDDHPLLPGDHPSPRLPPRLLRHRFPRGQSPAAGVLLQAAQGRDRRRAGRGHRRPCRALIGAQRRAIAGSPEQTDPISISLARLNERHTNMPKVQVTDVILRDAHQSLLATRMRLEDMLPICPKLDAIGYWSLECWGGATFDACVRFLKEDPWERLRRAPRRPAQHPAANAAARRRTCSATGTIPTTWCGPSCRSPRTTAWTCSASSTP